MYDLRPIGYVIGLLVLVLGLTMLVPMGVDLYYQNGHWRAFLESAVLTVLPGAMLAPVRTGFEDQGARIFRFIPYVDNSGLQSVAGP